MCLLSGTALYIEKCRLSEPPGCLSLADGPRVLYERKERGLRLPLPSCPLLEEIAHVAPVDLYGALRRQAVKHDFIPVQLVLPDELPALAALREVVAGDHHALLSGTTVRSLKSLGSVASSVIPI